MCEKQCHADKCEPCKKDCQQGMYDYLRIVKNKL